MAADFTIKQGETAPIFSDTLRYSDGSAVILTGATVAFAMRSFASAAPVALAGAATVVNATTGAVQFAPAASDTALPGNYQASWLVTFSGAPTPMSFPTDGWLWVEVQPSLAAEPTQLVSVADVKQYLRMDASQRDYDFELEILVGAARAEVEAIVGPVLLQTFDEWYDGGSNLISLRNRPSFGYGCQPVINVVAVSEYRGPIEYPCALVASPVFGSIYSAMLNPAMGTLTRRTAGGGTLAWQPGREQVHVVYQSGQAVVPMNVRFATMEIVRANFRTTAATGTGFEAAVDMQQTSATLPYWIPNKAREALAPSRRGPSIA